MEPSNNGKLICNIQSKIDKLWVKWINTYYIKGQDVLTLQVTQQCSWILNSILKNRERIVRTKHWEVVLDNQKYQTNILYRGLRGEKEQVTWKNIILNNYVRPKATFILWLALKGRLNTKDRLDIIGITTNWNTKDRLLFFKRLINLYYNSLL